MNCECDQMQIVKFQAKFDRLYKTLNRLRSKSLKIFDI
jgi:hypothetical protein